MLIGKIQGKTSTTEFYFLASALIKKFDYVQVMGDEGYILAQVIELNRDNENTFAKCNVLGFRKEGKLQRLRYPLKPNSEVLKPENDFIKQVLGLRTDKGAYIGTLENYSNIKVNLDLKRLLTHKVAVLARTGSGKSYTTSVLIEEILENKIPTLIIDPHGEYSSLKYPNSKSTRKMKSFGINPKGYGDIIQEFSPDTKINPNAIPLKLSKTILSSSDLLHLLPAKLSNTQLGLLYSALKNTAEVPDFESLITHLEAEENNVKYTLINIIEYIQRLNLFSHAPTELSDIVKPGKCSIINLRGIDPELQEVIVYKLLKDLFESRKRGDIPPFFAVIEEAQNFIPERNYGEAKSSKIIRQIAAESRKFGIGLCLITQRPSRIEKNALSQCSTHIILKITNPSDIKSVASSSEGLTSETEKEIRNTPIGTAMIAGLVDIPLFINIRPRKTKHGGESIDVLESVSFSEKSTDLIQVIQPSITAKDLEISTGNQISTTLIPCLFIHSKGYNLLINLNNGAIIQKTEEPEGTPFPLKNNLSAQQKKLFSVMITLKEFTAAEVFAKSGVQFSDIYETVNALEKQGYIEKKGTNYILNESLNLENLAFYGTPNFSRIEYHKKESKTQDPLKIKALLQEVIPIISSKECWLVKHEELIEVEKVQNNS